MTDAVQRVFTGRHMAAIMVAFFAVVIAVNFYMASLASSTFGGVVVKNSYVASQNFNHWLDEAAQEKALGWTAATSRAADGRVRVALSGVPQGLIALSAEARHPLGRLPDQQLAFGLQQDGSYLSDKPLPPGRWRLRLTIETAGHKWRSEEDLR